VYGDQPLLIDRLDRYRTDLLVAGGFEECFGIDRIGLVAGAVAHDMADGQEANLVSEATQLSPPVVSGSAGFHQDDAGGLLSHELEQLASGQSPLLADPAGVMGDSDLKDRLREIDGEHGILHGGLLLVLRTESGLAR
jgi:hypothetical protein